MSEKQQPPERVQGVDLEAVEKLVARLEEDLSRVRTGAGDVQRLREEVDALKELLDSPVRPHHSIRDALHGVRSALDRDWDDAARTQAFTASRYIAEIGRILGLP